MKATNDYEVTGHNRTILVTDLPVEHRSDLSELTITVGYTGEGNGIKGVTLDGKIIPAIMSGFKACYALAVMVKTPHIRNYLRENDPMALEQAEAALSGHPLMK